MQCEPHSSLDATASDCKCRYKCPCPTNSWTCQTPWCIRANHRLFFPTGQCPNSCSAEYSSKSEDHCEAHTLASLHPGMLLGWAPLPNLLLLPPVPLYSGTILASHVVRSSRRRRQKSLLLVAHPRHHRLPKFPHLQLPIVQAQLLQSLLYLSQMQLICRCQPLVRSHL